MGRGPIPTPNHPAFGVMENPSSVYGNMYLPSYNEGGKVVGEGKVEHNEFVVKSPDNVTSDITLSTPFVYDPNNRQYQGPAGDMSGKTPNRPGGAPTTSGAGSTNTGQGSQNPASMLANYYDQSDSFATQNPGAFQNSYGTGTMQQFASLPKIGLSGGGSLYPGSQDIPYGNTGERLAQIQSQFYAEARSRGATDEQAAHWASQQSALFDMAERERRMAAQQRFLSLGPRRTRYS